MRPSADAATTELQQVTPAPFDFEATFRTDYARIARVIARVIGDRARAEELAVETFWRLWRNPRAHGDRCRSWMHRTATRLALDELRRRARRARYEQVLAFVARPRTPDELLSEAEEQKRVRTVLGAMPIRQAELLLLQSDGWAYGELARSLSLNPVSVGRFLSRARDSFRKEYVKRYGERPRESQ